MLGGIIFIFVIWFIPLIIWLIIKNPFEQKATCEASKKEILRDKRMFIYVVIFWITLYISNNSFRIIMNNI